MTTYAIVPQDQWTDELLSRFPDAPLVHKHRVLVFADEETSKLRYDYEDRGILPSSSYESIVSYMSEGLSMWAILQITLLKRVIAQFKPPREFING